jgi:multisubunit Na+/H+ antiporter MnhG subunit
VELLERGRDPGADVLTVTRQAPGIGAEEARLVLHEALIGVLMVVTTRVTLMLLARAALHRDRSGEGARRD